MNRVNSSELLQFSRRYRFAGGKLRRWKFIFRKGRVSLETLLLVRTTAGEPVKLKLRLDGVEEYRVQKRPNTTVSKISDFRLGFFQGYIYLNLNSLGLAPGDVPGVHDFRASELYAGGDALYWEEVPFRRDPKGSV